MTNFYKLKHGTKKEIIELLEQLLNFNLEFGTKWCNELCELRHKEIKGLCSLEDDKICPYMEDKSLIEKWLEAKE